MTRRRTLLALAGSALAGLAGCASDSGSDSANGTPDETPSPTPDETADGNSGDESEEGNEGAGRLSPPYVTDEVPETYEETLRPDGERRGGPLVRLDGTLYYVRVVEGSHESMPVTATAEQAATTDDGLAQFRLRVEVTDEKPDVSVVGGEPVELHGQFGLPSPLWITHDGGESWSFAFDDIDVRETSVAEELSVGDELAATYVVPGTVPAGPCSLAGEFAALWQANPDDYNKSSGVYPFEVELTLTES